MKKIILVLLFSSNIFASGLTNQRLEEYYHQVKSWNDRFEIPSALLGKWESDDDKHVVRVEPGKYLDKGEINYNFWSLSSRKLLIHRNRRQTCSMIKDDGKFVNGIICMRGLENLELLEKYDEIEMIWLVLIEKNGKLSFAIYEYFTRSKSFKTLEIVENLKRDY